MLTAIRRYFDPEGWLAGLPAQGQLLDRDFARTLKRRDRPGGRLFFWRRPQAPEPIEIRQRPISTLPAPAAIDHSVDALLGDARQRARVEVERHVDGMPRGRERAEKFSALVVGHELRTTRVVETELRRERRAAGQPVPDVDYRARLTGEMRALEAEISTERRAETFDPLTGQELDVREGQLALVRLLLDMDNARADLTRRRAMRAPVSGAGTTDSEGGQEAPQRMPSRSSIDLGMEL